MAEITKCCADACPYKDTCFRYKTESKDTYDYSFTCNEETGFEDYMMMNRN